MKKIFLQDTCFSHCIYSNNPLPPIQFSEDIEWDRSKNFTEDDFVVYTDRNIPFARDNKNKNIAWLIEPEFLQPEMYRYVKENYFKFNKIFTSDKSLLLLENSILIPYGGCWVTEKEHLIYPKNKLVSIIASGKKELPGHRLRHEIIHDLKDSISVFGNGYNPIKNKIQGLKDYMFHIVVENVKKDFWFTEKLIDCLVTGCVPIYHGCPSIHEFFNPEGFITFDSLHELKLSIDKLNLNLYNSKKDAIEENFVKAKEYLLAEKSVSKYF